MKISILGIYHLPIGFTSILIKYNFFKKIIKNTIKHRILRLKTKQIMNSRLIK